MDNKNDPIYRALAIVAQLTQASDALWLVGGSTGLMLRGLALDNRPRDLDLYADEEDARRLHKLLQDYSVDEQEVNVSGIYRSVLSHYSIEGVSIELVGGFEIKTGIDLYKVEVSRMLVPYMESIQVDGYKIGIVPFAHEMWFNVLRRRDDRVKLIANALQGQLATHKDAFLDIEETNKLSLELVARVHAILGIEETRESS
ncbi:hypothetical protein Back11_23520 [Paenibacillus baekrokdamisoli]|uniref:Uncharacterized protein n=1 Tax=Paenibacillus baekrokdamisoli TaxID=1712516 RepID=A0A3G9IQ55_9BACL|nr:hypothetical protein [Paenibacillus baekrokdamisoli]MBB3069639.1 hypothetical protein [Paenibacillus baekrokdamisoli]BBH21007.1 hypothetical protein Back11_23520 [Paenibacillus baekrokdamisoli]